MADLTEPQKREIVEALACYDESREIIAYFREEHELELTHKQVGRYDPTRPYYDAGDKWREIFAARRKAYLEEVTAAPVANQGYRLQRLQEAVEEERKGKQWALMAQLLKQAAEEVGGVLTNQRHTTIEEGRKLSAKDMTPEERQAALAEIIRKVQDDMRGETVQ